MAWPDEMVPMVRGMVNDLASTTYSTPNLQSILVIAGRYVSGELTFTQVFNCTVSTVTIVPDPTDPTTKDDDYVNLVCLKAASILDRASAVLAARQALYVKDGNSAIDLRGIALAAIKLMEQGWDKVYEEAKYQYQVGDGVIGAVVCTPFRLFAQGGYPTQSFLTGDPRNRNYFLP